MSGHSTEATPASKAAWLSDVMSTDATPASKAAWSFDVISQSSYTHDPSSRVALALKLDALGICGGDCISDYNLNGICDSNEIIGCTDASACNYDASATMDDGSCFGIPEGFCDCEGNVFDECGVCGGTILW